MYHPIGIQKLSDTQLSRLRNGHPVRVKIGSHHKIHLSIPQLKKLHTAHKNGKASTITFDPYQMEAHGSGLFGDIARKGINFIKKYHLQDSVNPLIHRGKSYAHRAVDKLSGYAHNQINRVQPIGNGIMGDATDALLFNYQLNKKKRGYGVNCGRRGKGVVGGVFNGAAGLSNIIGGPGSEDASKVLNGIGGVANFFGLGVRRHNNPPTKRRRTRKGKGFLEDLGKLAKETGKELAKTGVNLGANYINDKIGGLGVRPKLYKRKQRKYHGGGALMPAGISP